MSVSIKEAQRLSEESLHRSQARRQERATRWPWWATQIVTAWMLILLVAVIRGIV